MRGQIADIGIDYNTRKPKISFLFNDKHILSQIEELKGLKLNIEVKKHREKRSLNANNYFWKLLQELCEREGLDSIEEYKRRVKQLGIFRKFRIEKDNISTFEKMWEQQGVAWFCEVFDTEIMGDIEFKIIHAYYGSSSFNTKQMSRLIDDLVQDCIALNIETMTPEQLQGLKDSWGT